MILIILHWIHAMKFNILLFYVIVLSVILHWFDGLTQKQMLLFLRIPTI